MTNIYTIVGDTHAKNDNLDKIQELFRQVEALGHPVIWLGDMLDSKEIVRSKCLNAYYNYFRNSDLSHTVLVGNHDYHNLQCQDHSLTTLKALDNVDIVDVLTYKDGMLFLPYMHDASKFKQELTAIDLMKDPRGILIMHQGVVGFDYGNGFLEKEGISLEDLKAFKLVISGHFHSYQCKDNLLYIGTPFTHAFGETHSNKYLGLLNIDTLEVELLETKFPKHITGTINCDAPPNKKWSFEQEIEGILEIMFRDENYNRIILNGKKENISKYSSYIKTNKPNYKIIENPHNNIKNLIIDEKEDNKVKFSKWAEKVKQLDEYTIKLGLDILNVSAS